jgi:hypothetical protein
MNKVTLWLKHSHPSNEVSLHTINSSQTIPEIQRFFKIGDNYGLFKTIAAITIE